MLLWKTKLCKSRTIFVGHTYSGEYRYHLWTEGESGDLPTGYTFLDDKETSDMADGHVSLAV